MKFFYLCASGALTLEVLARGVNFASALNPDPSKASSSTKLMRKKTRVLKEKVVDSFAVMKGHRTLEESVNLEWEATATNLFSTPNENVSNRKLSMSADGKTFAVGSRHYNNGLGIVQVYSLVDGIWTQKGEDLVGEIEGEQLGNSVALSDDGSVLAFSIWYTPVDTKEGCIRVYKFENDAWIQMGEQIDGANANEYFGHHMSLSNNGLIVAGTGYIDSKGHVRVFQYANNQWEQLGNTIIGQTGSAFGSSHSLSGNGQVMVIGSNSYSGTMGSVSVYEYVSNDWVQIGQTLYGESGSRFGYSCQISKDTATVIVGAPHSSTESSTPYFGYVEVFQYIDGQWKKIGQRISATSKSDGVGYEVSISSDGAIILVPSPGDDENGFDQGAVRVYKYSESQWNQLGGNIYGNPVATSSELFGVATAFSGNGYTLVGLGVREGASVYKLPVVEEWDGIWFIDYDSVTLSGNVLTSTYLTKPDVDSDFTVSHTAGTCDSEGLPLDNSVITNVDSTATIVDLEVSDTLSVAKTMNPVAIAEDHSGSFVFCETVTLTNTGAPETETVNVVQSQSEYTVTASFLAEIGSYSVTLEDDSVVTTVDEQSLSPEGTIAVERCGGLSDSINPGDKLCLDIFVSDSSSVGVDRIHNLDLKQGTSTFAAIDDGVNQYTALVEVSCVDGACTVDIVVPESLFTDESGASELTLAITGDAYLYEKGGAKDENESKGFSYSVKLEKPCESGFLRGFVEDMLSD